MNDYQRYLKIAEKYNLSILSEEVVNIELEKSLNFEELFKDLSDKNTLTTLNHIDDFILTNIRDEYKENYFFQYCVHILSDYSFGTKTEFVKTITCIYTHLLNLDLSSIDNLLTTLKSVESSKTKIQETLATKINTFFSNDKIIKFISDKFNNKEILAQILNNNYFYGQEYETNFLKALILLDGNIIVEDILNHVTNAHDILNYALIKIKEKLGIVDESVKSKNILIEYINEKYIKEGYFFHGTSSVQIESVKKLGLTAQNSYLDFDIIRKINNMFENHGMYRAFEGKAGEIKWFNFCITDSPFHAIYYANQSPEYLSRFCANGIHMHDLNKYDNEAFWRRDFDTCKKNVLNLMESNNFSKEEEKFVLDNFLVLWNDVVKENQYPVIFIGKRKLIGRDVSLKYENAKDNVEKYSLINILKYLTSPDNIHDRRIAKINSKHLSLINLPNLHDFYKISSQDKLGLDKYYMCEGEKIYPDILITTMFQNTLVIKLIDDKRIIKINNVLFIPKDLEYLNVVIDDDFYTQSLDLLISESAVSLTNDGEEIIRQLREKFSIKFLCQEYKRKVESLLKKQELTIKELFRLVDNYYIKYRCMTLYNKYYADISGDKIDVEHYSVDKNNNLRKYKDTFLIPEEMRETIIKKVKIALNDNIN